MRRRAVLLRKASKLILHSRQGAIMALVKIRRFGEKNRQKDFYVEKERPVFK